MRKAKSERPLSAENPQISWSWDSSPWEKTRPVTALTTLEQQAGVFPSPNAIIRASILPRGLSRHLTPLSWLQDCFSMANVSWYGGASVRAQRWPLNGAESPAQPFVSGDFSESPHGYGPVLERYFLGSTGN